MARLELNGKEIETIINSLGYTKEAFSDYDRYPNEEFRRMRIQEVDSLLAKLKAASR